MCAQWIFFKSNMQCGGLLRSLRLRLAGRYMVVLLCCDKKRGLALGLTFYYVACWGTTTTGLHHFTLPSSRRLFEVGRNTLVSALLHTQPHRTAGLHFYFSYKEVHCHLLRYCYAAAAPTEPVQIVHPSTRQRVHKNTGRAKAAGQNVEATKCIEVGGMLLFLALISDDFIQGKTTLRDGVAKRLQKC